MNARFQGMACLGSAALAATAGWCEAQCPASLSTLRPGPAIAFAGNRLFIAGSRSPDVDSVDVYEPRSGSWSLASLSQARVGLAATAVGRTALFAGGYRLAGAWLVTDRVDLHDTRTGTWSTAALSQARAYVTAATVGSTALFAGGYGVGDQPVFSDRVDWFDAQTGTWSSASLSVARSGMSVAVVGDRVIFAGGWTSATPVSLSDPSAAVDVFDATTGTWSSATLHRPHAGMAVTSVGGVALFAGGWEASSPAWIASDVVDRFDAARGSWSVTSLSGSRIDLAATSVAGRAYFAGGWEQDPSSPTSPFTVTDAIDVYDPLTSTWSLGHLSEPRYSVSAVSFGERAYFAGGLVAPHAPRTVVDVFDAASGVWSVLPLTAPRGSMAAVALPDRLLFLGGEGTCGGGDPGPDPCYSAAVDVFPAGGARPFCFGDGGGAPCSCGNFGSGPSGCANSTGAGATLASLGCNSMREEDVRFEASALPSGAAALLFVGHTAIAAGEGAPYGDGLRCVGGAVTRLGIRVAGADGSAHWGPGLARDAGFENGVLRRFQVVYRDATSPCGSGFNATNGLEVELAP